MWFSVTCSTQYQVLDKEARLLYFHFITRDVPVLWVIPSNQWLLCSKEMNSHKIAHSTSKDESGIIQNII